MVRTFLLLSLVIATTGCANVPTNTQPESAPLQRASQAREGTTSPLDALLLSVEQRASIASMAATQKWKTGKPVEDSARERQVIDKAVAQAPHHGLDPQRVRDFFSDQIEASKLLQYELLHDWQIDAEAAARAKPVDLSEVRKALDLIQGELLANLARFDRTHDRQSCATQLASTIEADESRSYPLHLAMIRATGRLCSPK